MQHRRWVLWGVLLLLAIGSAGWLLWSRGEESPLPSPPAAETGEPSQPVSQTVIILPQLGVSLEAPAQWQARQLFAEALRQSLSQVSEQSPALQPLFARVSAALVPESAVWLARPADPAAMTRLIAFALPRDGLRLEQIAEGLGVPSERITINTTLRHDGQPVLVVPGELRVAPASQSWVELRALFNPSGDAVIVLLGIEKDSAPILDEAVRTLTFPGP